MSVADYIIMGNVTKLFIASQSDGTVYQYDLPIKLGNPSAGSGYKDRTRARRENSNLLRRVNVSLTGGLSSINFLRSQMLF